MKIEAQIIPKRGSFKYLGPIIQGDGKIGNDDHIPISEQGGCDGGSPLKYCAIKMFLQGLKVSSSKWWLDQHTLLYKSKVVVRPTLIHYCIRQSIGQLRIPTYRR